MACAGDDALHWQATGAGGVNAPAVVLLQAEGHLRMPLPRIARVEIKESATLQPFEPQSHVAADQGA